MADIFIRPYDQQRKSPMRFVVTAIVVLAITLGLVKGWIWLDSRSSNHDDSDLVLNDQPVESPAAPVKSTATGSLGNPPATGSATATDPGAQQLFTRAQALANDGKLQQSRDLLSQVVHSATSEGVKNNALRMQGRITMKMFLSSTPMPEKKSYVIQPGDSLDRIARKNKTTVELIRVMNDITGDLIYPGRSLLLPAEPLVVVVNKTSCTLDLTLSGKLLKRYVVGLGIGGKTPAGTFKTVVHQTNPDWTPPGGGIIPYGDPKNILGTRWMSIQDESRPELQGFGIHGTPLRDSIGAETSNGCVRMLNEEVEELFMIIPRGTKVVITE